MFPPHARAMIDKLTRQDFEGLAPASLFVQYEGAEVPVSVVELRDLPDRSSRAAPFAVELEGPRDPLLPQGIHVLRHPRLGPLELFMVPLARGASQARYELIFN